MNEDQFDDLKQFIDSKISQSEQRLMDDIDSKISQSEQRLKESITRIESKIDDVDLKVDTISDTLSADLRDHDMRITKLKTKAA